MCALKDFNSVKNCCNSHALALVSMSHIADRMLLKFLAMDISRMREARIIIWLQSNSSTSGDLMHLISAQANLHSFLNLLVFDSMSRDAKGKIMAHRLPTISQSNFSAFC